MLYRCYTVYFGRSLTEQDVKIYETTSNGLLLIQSATPRIHTSKRQERGTAYHVNSRGYLLKTTSRVELDRVSWSDRVDHYALLSLVFYEHQQTASDCLSARARRWKIAGQDSQRQGGRTGAIVSVSEEWPLNRITCRTRVCKQIARAKICPLTVDCNPHILSIGLTWIFWVFDKALVERIHTKFRLIYFIPSLWTMNIIMKQYQKLIDIVACIVVY